MSESRKPWVFEPQELAGAPPIEHTVLAGITVRVA